MADLQQKQYEEQHRRWYAEWIQKQYDGPGCRAKIVGRTKYDQIVRAVKGELRRAADNSKFRFWVRAKGFRMGRPTPGTGQPDDGNGLYVVDTRNGGSLQPIGGAVQQHCYKKVAVVDEFFDIIFRVHCSGGGVSARHSGQKRTHRMVSTHIHPGCQFHSDPPPITVKHTRSVLHPATRNEISVFARVSFNPHDTVCLRRSWRRTRFYPERR